MLFDIEQKLRRSYVDLPLGVRRLWIATSVLWLVAYLILNSSDLLLLWKGATAGPNSTCAQVLANDDRRSSCETVEGFPAIPSYLEGKSSPFGPYFEKYRRDDKLMIWLCTPIAWLGLIWAFIWVRRGFEAEKHK